MTKLFGTDGIRGRANETPITALMVTQIALALSSVLKTEQRRYKVVIAKDTRLSGYMVEPALTAGFIAAGIDVILVGPLPTPAVAMLTRSLRADIGVMISASHNPYHDNGIKIFGADGYKISDALEQKIEELVDQPLDHIYVSADKMGRASRLDDAPGRYIEFVKQSFPKGLRLDGLKVVIDCAHGAAYKISPRIIWELGADVVIPLGVDPNGININHHCGATHPEAMQDYVVKHGADIGLALDGDADRLIVCDEKGEVIDGDQIMALIAHNMKRQGLLQKDEIAATVMSNLGLERFLAQEGIKLARTAVGDRMVMDYMRQHGLNLGGEQSGHIILADFATTGDGTIAALQVLAALKASAEKASTLCHVFEPVPQILKNVRTPRKIDLNAPLIATEIEKLRAKLGGRGRVIVRQSGTEPLVRVMVEGDDRQMITQEAEKICALIAQSA